MGRRATTDGPSLDPALWRGQATTVESRPGVWIPGTVLVLGSPVVIFFMFGESYLWRALAVAGGVSAVIAMGRRLFGRSPWVIVSDEGVAVGNVYTSALSRRNAVRWDDVLGVSLVGEPAHVKRKQSGLIPRFPKWFVSWLPREFAIACRDGRVLVVRAPLRGTTLDHVRAEVVSRWRRFGDPEGLRRRASGS